MSRAGFIGVSAPNTRRRRRQNTTVPITAIRVPASDILTSGQALQDTANWAAFLDPANYASVAGTIETVTVNYTGDTPDAVTPLWGDQVNHFSITVEDSVGNTRTFATLPRTVAQTDLVLTFETTSDGETFTLPLFNAGTVNAVMQIDDGPEIAITAWNDAALTQTVARAGIHTLRLRGTARSLRFRSDATSAAKVRRVSNLGDLGWTNLRGAFEDCDGMTSFDAGTTDTSAVTAFNSMFKGCNGLVTCVLPDNFIQPACTTFARLFTQCFNLTTAIDVSGWDVSNVRFMDETFNGCNSMSFENLRLDLWDLGSLQGRGEIAFNSMFNFLPDAGVLPQAIYDAFLIAQDAATLNPRQFFAMGQSVYTPGGAAEAARTSLISKGYSIEDAGNATPEVAAAPTIGAITDNSITITLPADPFSNGLSISTWAGVTNGRGLDYREVGTGSWVRFGDGYTEGQSVPVTGLSAGTEYEFRAVYANFNSVAEGVSNGLSTTAATNTGSESDTVKAEAEGSEPVITVDDTNPNALTFIVTGGNHPGTYTQNKADSDAAITAATLAVAPACLALPTISGTTTAGNDLTVTPGLWVFAGADPGDQTWQWENDTDGSLTGQTTLVYKAQVTDVGDTLSVDETFGGVTVSSASTASIAAGDTTAPTLVPASSTPADGSTGVSGSANLIAVFSENIVKGSGYIYLWDTVLNAVDELVDINDPIACVIDPANPNQLIINPHSNIGTNRQRSIRWDAGAVKDIAGNPIAANTGDTLWNFDTFADNTAPTLVPASCTPADGATNVAVGSNITLVFNETVVAGTGNFYIYEDGVLSETIAVGSATIGTTDVVLNPVSDFTDDVDVSVRWDAGVVEDQSGNGYHMEIASGATGPTLEQDGSGNYYLDFDAMSDQLVWTSGSSAITQPFTTCFGHANQTLGVSAPRLFRAVGGGATAAQDVSDNCTQFAGSTAVSVLVHTGNPQVRLDEFNGASSLIRLDGVEENNLNPGTLQLVPATTDMRVGNVQTGNTGLPHWYFGFWIDRALTAQEKSDLEDYTADRAGVTL